MCNGVIPFMEVENTDEEKVNPGEFFQFYLSFLSAEATKDHLVGGWLFPRPRKHGQSNLNIHKEGEMGLFEPNMKVGPRTMALMLPALCEAVEQPKCTNHQIRTTSIIYIRRAGIPWLTIAKITGHQSIENLIKYYDLNLEAPGLVEVVGALAQGPSVATGGVHEKLVLESRQPLKKKIKVEASRSKGDERKEDGVKTPTEESKENIPPESHQVLSLPQTSNFQPPIPPTPFFQHPLPHQFPTSYNLPTHYQPPHYQYSPSTSLHHQPYQLAHQPPPYQFPPHQAHLYQQPPQFMGSHFQYPLYQTPLYQTPPYQTPPYQTPPYLAPPFQIPVYQGPPYQGHPYQTPTHQVPPYQIPVYQTPPYHGQVPAHVQGPVADASQRSTVTQSAILSVQAIHHGPPRLQEIGKPGSDSSSK